MQKHPGADSHCPHLCAAPALANVNFGATLDNATGVSTDGTAEFSQEDRLAL